MANQNVDFETPNDSGEDNLASVQPYEDGERGNAAIFNRPLDIVRERTETVRRELEDNKYLADADRALLMTATGSVSWVGVYDPGVLNSGCLILEPEAELTIRPFLAPAVTTPATATLLGVKFSTVTSRVGGETPPRAYSGANKITVDLVGSAGAALAVTVEGDPLDNVQITYDSTAVTGTTRQALIDAVNASAVCVTLGLSADLVAGEAGAGVLTTVGITSGALSGALEAEQHTLTAAGLAAFFDADAACRLLEGDVLAIYYGALTLPTQGGRRQAIADAPETGANCDGNLFVVRLNPEKAPLAIPIARVQGGVLHLLNGVALPPGATSVVQVNSLTASTVAPQSVATVAVAGTARTYSASDHVHTLALDVIEDNHISSDANIAASKLLAGSITNTQVSDTAAIAATKIANTPAGGVSATTVQAAINELDTDKAAASHSHLIADLPTNLSDPENLGVAAPGVALTLARTDHVHAHGNLTGGLLHAEATSMAAGFMALADKDKLDRIIPIGPVTEIQKAPFSNSQMDIGLALPEYGPSTGAWAYDGNALQVDNLALANVAGLQWDAVFAKAGYLVLELDIKLANAGDGFYVYCDGVSVHSYVFPVDKTVHDVRVFAGAGKHTFTVTYCQTGVTVNRCTISDMRVEYPRLLPAHNGLSYLNHFRDDTVGELTLVTSGTGAATTYALANDGSLLLDPGTDIGGYALLSGNDVWTLPMPGGSAANPTKLVLETSMGYNPLNGVYDIEAGFLDVEGSACARFYLSNTDPNIKCHCVNIGETTVDSGVTVINGSTVWRIELTSGLAKFFIGDKEVGRNTTDVPAAGTKLQPYIRVNSGDVDGVHVLYLDYLLIEPTWGSRG